MPHSLSEPPGLRRLNVTPADASPIAGSRDVRGTSLDDERKVAGEEVLAAPRPVAEQLSRAAVRAAEYFREVTRFHHLRTAYTRDLVEAPNRRLAVANLAETVGRTGCDPVAWGAAVSALAAGNGGIWLHGDLVTLGADSNTIVLALRRFPDLAAEIETIASGTREDEQRAAADLLASVLLGRDPRKVDSLTHAIIDHFAPGDDEHVLSMAIASTCAHADAQRQAHLPNYSAFFNAALSSIHLDPNAKAQLVRDAARHVWFGRPVMAAAALLTLAAAIPDAAQLEEQLDDYRLDAVETCAALVWAGAAGGEADELASLGRAIAAKLGISGQLAAHLAEAAPQVHRGNAVVRRPMLARAMRQARRVRSSRAEAPVVVEARESRFRPDSIAFVLRHGFADAVARSLEGFRRPDASAATFMGELAEEVSRALSTFHEDTPAHCAALRAVVAAALRYPGVTRAQRCGFLMSLNGERIREQSPRRFEACVQAVEDVGRVRDYLVALGMSHDEIVERWAQADACCGRGPAAAAS